MAAAKPETKLQKKIREALTARGAWCVKIAGGPFQRGLPDLIGLHKGRFFAIEVKMPGGKPTALQLESLRTIKRAGGQVAIAHSVDEALEVLDRIEAKRRRLIDRGS